MSNEINTSLSTQANKSNLDWIGESLDNSQWFISVFKVTGRYKDDSGINRQLVNQNTLPKLFKAVDWTITTTRRTMKIPRMKFIPFLGGSKENQVALHIHAFIEIPKPSEKWSLHDELKKNWQIYTNRVFVKNVELSQELWLQELDTTRSRNHLWYVQRNEGQDFMFGAEKVLYECKSCLI
jgi:hypothetical protein